MWGSRTINIVLIINLIFVSFILVSSHNANSLKLKDESNIMVPQMPADVPIKCGSCPCINPCGQPQQIIPPPSPPSPPSPPPPSPYCSQIAPPPPRFVYFTEAPPEQNWYPTYHPFNFVVYGAATKMIHITKLLLLAWIGAFQLLLLW